MDHRVHPVEQRIPFYWMSEVRQRCPHRVASSKSKPRPPIQGRRASFQVLDRLSQFVQQPLQPFILIRPFNPQHLDFYGNRPVGRIEQRKGAWAAAQRASLRGNIATISLDWRKGATAAKLGTQTAARPPDLSCHFGIRTKPSQPRRVWRFSLRRKFYRLHFPSSSTC